MVSIKCLMAMVAGGEESGRNMWRLMETKLTVSQSVSQSDTHTDINYFGTFRSIFLFFLIPHQWVRGLERCKIKKETSSERQTNKSKPVFWSCLIHCFTVFMSHVMTIGNQMFPF